MIHKFFAKKTSSGTVKNEIISNKELAEELHKLRKEEHLRKEKYNHLLYKMFGAQIYATDK